jgi:hypothetical protein
VTGVKPSRRRSATAGTLSSETEKRIHKLVLRAVRCSFGVEAALRRAVLQGASEMLEAGASFPAVRHAMAECVLRHPSMLPEKLSLVTGESRASAILTRMLSWTDTMVPNPPIHASP